MILVLSTLFLLCIKPSIQHGFLLVPPQRSSLWREGFDNPINYDDNQLWCGGRSNIQQLGGLCGVCGDPYQGPRENEAGGKYANGIIGRRYEFGVPNIDISIVLSAYHKGHFEFRICPHNSPTEPVKQECLNRYKPLPVSEDGTDIERAEIRYYPPGPGIYNLTLFIPKGMRCSQCVIQWRYRTGNSWGVDPDGKACVGCGIQEEFRNCADISIGGDDIISGLNPPPPLVDEQFLNFDPQNNLPVGEFDIRSSNNRDTGSIGNQQETATTSGRTGAKQETHEQTSKGNAGNSRFNNNIVGVTEPLHATIGSDSRSSNNGLRVEGARPNITGGVWNRSVESTPVTNKTNSKLEKTQNVRKVSNSNSDDKSRVRALVLSIIRKYDKMIRERKRHGKKTRTQQRNNIGGDRESQEMVKNLRYFVTRLQNHRLYTKLTKSAKERKATAMYRNKYNVINENSLEAQSYQRFWKFSPNPYFRNSRYFST